MDEDAKSTSDTISNQEDNQPDNQTNVCAKCGSELQENQKFCPECGNEVEDISSVTEVTQIDGTPAVVNIEAQPKGKSKSIRIALIVVIVVIAIVAGVFAASNLLVTVDSLCAQGKYEQAYGKASADEKSEVLAENIVAVNSKDLIETLDSDSSISNSTVSLMDGYYYNNDRLELAVAHVSITRAYSNGVQMYVLFANTDDDGWTRIGGCNTTEIADGDTENTQVVKYFVKGAIDNGYQLSDTQVKRINDQIEAETLNQVTFVNADQSE